MKIKMTIDECLDFADEWSRGMTIHEGSQGWRVVCMLLAEEVRRMRQQIADAPSAFMDTRDVLGICAPTEADFPALYALQGCRVRLVLDDAGQGDGA
ncbi:hypothetical protein [Aromatoleum anaerobium]|uniref:Uncharacterized protein n=1 Tax=Aromatoleum anaerobium TaxID=182180 RepID=A0ABX1PRN8_9RHOO|nr:hypothetical protein [Aromatoleum anaerobium]MCK0507938.1 hypothetical protein [Aromatoleum anaerobium]